MNSKIRIGVLCLIAAGWCVCAEAGTIDSPGGIGSTNSAMYTLKQLHERLTTGTNTPKRTTTFLEPTAPPGGSGTGVTINAVVGVCPKYRADAATTNDVRTGKTYWSLGDGWLVWPDWGHLAGTGTRQLSPATTVVSNGFYATTDLFSVDSDLATENIRSGVTIFGVAGDTNVVNTGSGTAAATDIRDGKLAWVKGTEITGLIQDKVLSASIDNMLAGFYTGTTLSATATNLQAVNIVTGTVIFGVAGTYIYERTPIPAPVMKSGQTNSYQTGDDGYHEAGATERTPRFVTITTNGNEQIVLDDVTGLTWIMNASTGGMKSWSNAIVYCENLDYGGYQDWRLPNVNELASLVDYQRFSPMAPEDSNPFFDVRESRYWTSTTDPQDTNRAYHIYMHDGSICSRGEYNFLKSNTYWVWPVRGGN